MGVFMINPTKPGVYTTIFKDGSIILYNEWMMFDNPNLNKWYFNESYHGGIIHWFKPEEEYKPETYYKLPRHVLYDLVCASITNDAYYQYFDTNELLAACSKYNQENSAGLKDLVELEIEHYYKGYEI
jgi:hypothetical protein